MATTALKKLEDQLTCPVCLSYLNDPRVLLCLHTYCRRCLEGLARPSQAEELVMVECPVCRKETRVKSVDELQKAFQVVALFDIKRDLERSHKQKDAVEKSDMSEIEKCFAHQMKLEFYCNECSKLLCSGCTNGAHKFHQFTAIHPAAEKKTEKMKSYLSELESKLASIKEGISEVEGSCERAHSEENEIQETVRKHFSKARKLLDEREAALVQEVHQMKEQKVQNLTVRKSQLQLVETQLRSCQEAVSEYLQMDSPIKALASHKAVEQMISDASCSFDETTSWVRRAANDIGFFIDPCALDRISQLGVVYVKVPQADMCLVQGDGLVKAKVGQKAEVQLSLYDRHQVEVDVKVAGHMVTADLYPALAESDVIKCIVEERESNQCLVSYVPTLKGPHKMEVEVVGRPLKGSPFHISVRGPLKSLGPQPCRMIPGLKKPWGMTVNQTGNLCVAVSGKKEVVVLDGHLGKRLSTVVKKKGLLEATLQEPTGIALDRDGNLIFSDFHLSLIHRIGPDGNVLRSVGSSGNRPLEFSYPAALAVHPVSGQIYVSEWQENNRVQILNHNFSFHKVFGGSGSGPGQFQCPCGIAFDSKGNVYVADCNNSRIQVFTSEGDYVREFGKRGKTEGKMGLPMGLCIDLSSDILFVTDIMNHRVSLFTVDGEFLQSFGRHGTGPGEFNRPQGIATDKYRFLYVSDTMNDRVQVF